MSASRVWKCCGTRITASDYRDLFLGATAGQSARRRYRGRGRAAQRVRQAQTDDAENRLAFRASGFVGDAVR